MTSKELKHMSRSELLQMLLSQVEENERLQNQVSEVHKKLEERRIDCENAGSIAEAALKINGVFEAAQQAAQQYLDNIRDMEIHQNDLRQQLETEARGNAEAIVSEANHYKTAAEQEADTYKVQVKQEADTYKAQVEQEADAYKAQVQQEADAYSAKVRNEADEYWSKIQTMVDNLLKEHQSLTALLQSVGRK